MAFSSPACTPNRRDGVLSAVMTRHCWGRNATATRWRLYPFGAAMEWTCWLISSKLIPHWLHRWRFCSCMLTKLKRLWPFGILKIGMSFRVAVSFLSHVGMHPSFQREHLLSMPDNNNSQWSLSPYYCFWIHVRRLMNSPPSLLLAGNTCCLSCWACMSISTMFPNYLPPTCSDIRVGVPTSKATGPSLDLCLSSWLLGCLL